MATQTTESKRDENDEWLRAYFVNRLGALDADRAGYWNTWRDISSQFAPRRGRFLVSANDYTRGRRKDQRIINNTPILAARVMASGMMAGISSPARPWFKLKLADEDANKDEGARAWLDEVQKRLLHVFAKSNLYNCLHTLYAELGTFGTAALWVDEDEEDLVRGYTLTVGEYWLSSSKRSAVDTCYRSLWWTVRQIVDEFGRDKVSSGIQSAYDNGFMDREYEIIHAVEPNPNAAAKDVRGPANLWNGHISQKMPFRSVWFERGQQSEDALLRVSGYEEFSVMAPRWEIAGNETYGSGPGWTGVGDALSLQVIERRKQELIDKSSKPPMVGPPSLNNKPASLLPGGLTIVSDTNGAEYKAAIKIDPAAIQHCRIEIASTEERINKAFYADLFLMMAQSDRREITAREIDERHEEKMLMLGPVLERLHDELLDPLVTRVFNIMARNGLIPPPPDSIHLPSVQIEFISLLAQAQKAVATIGIERFWAFLGQLAQGGRPDALDRGDVDGTADAYADMLGVPAGVVMDLPKADKIRAARAQKQQAADTMAAMAAAAQTGKVASEIDIGGGQNAVQAMLGTGGVPA